MSDAPEPANLEAERAVLGAILIDNAVFHLVASLSPKVFFRKAHREIWTALHGLCDAGQPADLVSLKNALGEKAEDVGGPAYIASLVDGVPRSTNVRYYADIVREKATLRLLRKIGRTLEEQAISGSVPSAELMRDTDTALLALASSHGSVVRAIPLSDSLSALTADLARRVERKGQLIGYPTGFRVVDSLTLGWQRRKMVIIAGRTSHGKSVMALHIARAIAETGARVVYFSLEMERQELEYRLLSALSGYPLSKILWGNIPDDDFAAIATAQETMHGLPLVINDTPSLSVPDMRSECRQIQSEHGLGAVVVDYVQLARGTDGDNRTQELAHISRSLAILGKELNVPMIVLSQLSRGEKNAAKPPDLWDLRESGALEQDSDLVAFLHPRKPSDVEGDASLVPMYFLLKKHRGGRRGTAKITLERDCTRFVDDWPMGVDDLPDTSSPAKSKRVARSPNIW